MKKVLTSISCLVCGLTCFSAYAVNIKPFVGANIGLNGVEYADNIKYATNEEGIELPESFFGIGGELGVKFETEKVYSAAITFAYDYTLNSKADIDVASNAYISSAEVGFSAWGITFDNYIRVSGKSPHRQDIVLGLGLFNANERFKMNVTDLAKTTYGLSNVDDDDDGTVVVFKVGYNYTMSKHIDWYLNGRLFIPTDSKSDIDAMFNMNAGVRFLF